MTMVFVTEAISWLALCRAVCGQGDLAAHTTAQATYGQKRSYHGAGDHGGHRHLSQRTSTFSISHTSPLFRVFTCQCTSTIVDVA